MQPQQPALPGNVGSAELLIRKHMALGQKSKERDSGVPIWGTTSHGEISELKNVWTKRSTLRATTMPRVVREMMMITPIDYHGPNLPMPLPPVITVDYFKRELKEAQLHYPAEYCLLVGK